MLKTIPIKHINMAYMNCEQDHNEIKHINKNRAMNNTTYQLREKKNKHKNKIKYLHAWAYPPMEEYFRNQRNFHFFEV